MCVCRWQTEDSGSDWSEKRAFIIITSPLEIEVHVAYNATPTQGSSYKVNLLTKTFLLHIFLQSQSESQSPGILSQDQKQERRNRIQSVESIPQAITNVAGIAGTHVPRRSLKDFHTKRQASSEGPLVHRNSPRISGIAGKNVPVDLTRSRGYITPQRETPSL